MLDIKWIALASLSLLQTNNRYLPTAIVYAIQRLKFGSVVSADFCGPIIWWQEFKIPFEFEPQVILSGFFVVVYDFNMISFQITTDSS